MRIERSKSWRRRRAAAVLAAGCVMAGPAAADGSLTDAIAAGKPIIDLRLRYEGVDQSNKPDDAEAVTMRSRLGYQTGDWNGFSALADFDYIQHIGAHTYFDTAKGSSARYPIVADPDMTTLDRLQLSYDFDLGGGGKTDTTITVGRQKLVLGDARFVGDVGWRQHDQTYDAVALVNKSVPGLTLTYAYVNRVNRVFGPDSVAQVGAYGSHSDLFNAVYSGLKPYLTLEAYAYLLDLKQAPTQSTATYGFHGEGAYPLFSGLDATLKGAYAHQQEYADNPLAIDLSYSLVEGGLTYAGFSAATGEETMGGNGTIGFSTPFATLHAFDGWADMFLTTPVNGIDDFYVKASYGFALSPLFIKVTPTIVYHDFSADHIDAHYGNEWDGMIDARIDAHLSVGVAFANYTRGVAPYNYDKKLTWVYVGYSY